MTLTKEWLKHTIAELEEERDAVPGVVNEDAAKALAAMKLALASLEAEAVGEVVLGEYDDFDSAFEHGKAVGWNAYRAAMLQGADGNAPAHFRSRPAQSSLSPAQGGNSPVIPDGWVACSERMPEIGIKVLCFPVNDEPIHATYNGQVWLQDISWSTSDEPIDNVISCNVFHWMPLPAAPQQN